MCPRIMPSSEFGISAPMHTPSRVPNSELGRLGVPDASTGRQRNAPTAWRTTSKAEVDARFDAFTSRLTAPMPTRAYAGMIAELLATTRDGHMRLQYDSATTADITRDDCSRSESWSSAGRSSSSTTTRLPAWKSSASTAGPLQRSAPSYVQDPRRRIHRDRSHHAARPELRRQLLAVRRPSLRVRYRHPRCTRQYQSDQYKTTRQHRADHRSNEQHLAERSSPGGHGARAGNGRQEPRRLL